MLVIPIVGLWWISLPPCFMLPGFEFWSIGRAERETGITRGPILVLFVHVTPSECEQAFVNLPFIAAEDEKHSQYEKRLFGLGQTDSGRRLYMVFIFRRSLIRVNSARNMSRKGRKV
jgi:uncharacterized DUF497 family protein